MHVLLRHGDQQEMLRSLDKSGIYRSKCRAGIPSARVAPTRLICSPRSFLISLLVVKKGGQHVSTSFVRHITALHPVPLYAVIIASLSSSGLLLAHLMGWQLWLVALLILLVWSPIFVRITAALYRQYRWLAFFFVLLVAQSVHFTEHIAQMIQIHLLGLSGAQAHGIIGVLDFEWVHFIFDGGWVPICAYTLFVVYRKSNPWLWILVPVVTWHAIEHIAIMSVYLRTGIVGSPGLLAHGGFIGGGLPLTRPDLHFLYNLIEETLIVIGYVYQVKHLPSGNLAGASLATTPI